MPDDSEVEAAGCCTEGGGSWKSARTAGDPDAADGCPEVGVKSAARGLRLDCEGGATWMGGALATGGPHKRLSVAVEGAAIGGSSKGAAGGCSSTGVPISYCRGGW